MRKQVREEPYEEGQWEVRGRMTDGLMRDKEARQGDILRIKKERGRNREIRDTPTNDPRKDAEQ